MSKAFIVTGTSRGLGLEFVKQLASKGHTVFACARNPEKSSGLQALASNNAAVQSITKLSPNGIDVLINNSGIGSDMNDTVETASAESYMTVFQTNVVGTSNVTEAFLPLLRKGNGRRIINISSLMGSIESTKTAMAPPYCVSKAGENMLTKLFSLHLKDENFVVVSVHPGWVQTDMGGPQAPVTPSQSIKGILEQVEKLTLKDNGTYVSFEGNTLPW
ncbi:4-dihydrotrisporin dehydrogenase [Phycomyces nitens]|nr:4-dihydrotrisporin dehydrogenase [Phycomyces nitens]